MTNVSSHAFTFRQTMNPKTLSYAKDKTYVFCSKLKIFVDSKYQYTEYVKYVITFFPFSIHDCGIFHYQNQVQISNTTFPWFSLLQFNFLPLQRASNDERTRSVQSLMMADQQSLSVKKFYEI